MERAMLWFKCAAVHDPVRPVIKRAAKIGWEAKQRKVDLEIESDLRPDELLLRMKGWFTSDVNRAIKIFQKYGRLKVLDDQDLVIETENMEQIKELEKNLEEEFNKEVWVEHMPKKQLL